MPKKTTKPRTLDGLDRVLMVRLSESQHTALSEIAREEHKTMAAWARDAISAVIGAAEFAHANGLHADEWIRLEVRLARLPSPIVQANEGD